MSQPFLLGRRGLLLAGATVATTAAPADAQQSAIEELHGSLTLRSYPALEAFVLRNVDKVVGMKITAAPSDQRPGLYVGVSNGQFVTYRTPTTPIELVAMAGFRYEHGQYVFDSFFIIKSGGMHQGTLSFGLEQVPEATVRLAAGVRIRRVNLR